MQTDGGAAGGAEPPAPVMLTILAAPSSRQADRIATDWAGLWKVGRRTCHSSLIRAPVRIFLDLLTLPTYLAIACSRSNPSTLSYLPPHMALNLPPAVASPSGFLWKQTVEAVSGCTTHTPHTGAPDAPNPRPPTSGAPKGRTSARFYLWMPVLRAGSLGQAKPRRWLRAHN